MARAGMARHFGQKRAARSALRAGAACEGEGPGPDLVPSDPDMIQNPGLTPSSGFPWEPSR